MTLRTPVEFSTFWVWEFLGRLHPLIVHFPIGLLIVAALLELFAWRGDRPGLRDGISAMLIIGACSAVAACLAGLLLGNSGDYAGGATLTIHQWTGIGTALIALIAWFLHWKAVRTDTQGAWAAYRSTLAATVVTIAIAGHHGAALTHGSTYLTEVLPWNQADPALMSDAADVLADFTRVSAEAYSSAELDRLNLEVRAIFAHSCYRCHSTEKHEGGLLLDTKEGVFTGGDSGPVLIAGEPQNSELVRRLSLPRAHEEAMPEKGKPLTPAQIELISLWIDLGAHWADRELKIFPEAELALNRPALPAPPSTQHPIDQLVNAYFEETRQPWPNVIDDRAFVRRAYLDIIGLLPSPEQVDGFVSDPDPAKREHLIDHLLDQDHAYTQHWLSFWNDLLRNDYSGTGFITGGRRQITDWLYTALFENRSYNKMARELLNPDDRSSGFIRGIQWRGDVNNSQRIEMQAAQNISQSLLGINLKCASCHNSFVSNLTLDQAYGFATIFAADTLEVYRCDKPTGRMSEPAFLYPELGRIEGATVEERLVELADVIVQPANGRFYRTIVNRYWDRLLGRGIVMPVDEMDQPPWSQDVLDWLAADFVEAGADLKHLIRRIMTSRTYQLEASPISTEQSLAASGYTFEGPTLRRLTAEQFADAMSQILGPVYHSVAFDPFDYVSEAQWIWHPERVVDRIVLPAPGKRYFRRTFELASEARIVEAEALITVDHAFSLFINGSRVQSGDDWRKVHRFDPRPYLQPGPNVIALEGNNEGELPNPAGVLFSLNALYEDGTAQTLVSDDAWKSTDETPGEGWEDLEFDDSLWSSSRRYGRFERSPWGRLIDFRHTTAPPAGAERLAYARASLVTLDPFLKALGRPTRENVTTRRNNQSTLLNALELTNGEFFYDALLDGAEQWLDRYPDSPREMVEALYRAALGRFPSSAETRTALALLGEAPGVAETQDLLWAVFMLPEFQLIW